MRRSQLTCSDNVKLRNAILTPSLSKTIICCRFLGNAYELCKKVRTF
jgi:hypothetical protein